MEKFIAVTMKIHNISEDDLLDDCNDDTAPKCTSRVENSAETDAAIALAQMQDSLATPVQKFVPKFTSNNHPCGLSKNRK